jgi:hypothetical protein
MKLLHFLCVEENQANQTGRPCQRCHQWSQKSNPPPALNCICGIMRNQVPTMTSSRQVSHLHWTWQIIKWARRPIAIITTSSPLLQALAKAVNGRGTVRPYEDPIQEVQAKRLKSSTSINESLSQFWPPNLLAIIKSIVKLESPCPVKPLFVFNLNSKAVGKNYLILKKIDLDIGHALEAQSLCC